MAPEQLEAFLKESSLQVWYCFPSPACNYAYRNYAESVLFTYC